MNTARTLVRCAVAATLFAVTPNAEAETRQACADRAKVIERLSEKYGETLQSMGLQRNSGLVEIYASPETGTWTILVSRPDGKACLLAAGQMWEADAAPLAAPGKDA